MDSAFGALTDFAFFLLITGRLLGWGDSTSASSSSCLQVHATPEVHNFSRLASRSGSSIYKKLESRHSVLVQVSQNFAPPRSC